MKNVSHGQLAMTIPQTSEVARLLERSLPIVHPVVATAEVQAVLFLTR